ncbi:hypothetical protein DB346_09925 [Verrucomicrobia bacterium LW23]|nr:hypothetical protein DB346_09925 [Verrucomicrobia bacterium LW23]
MLSERMPRFAAILLKGSYASQYPSLPGPSIVRDFITRAYLARIGEKARPVMATQVRPTFVEAPVPPSRWRMVRRVALGGVAMVVVLLLILPAPVTSGFIAGTARLLGIRTLPRHLMPVGQGDSTGRDNWASGQSSQDRNAMGDGNASNASSNSGGSKTPHPGGRGGRSTGTRDGESRDPASLPAATSAGLPALPAQPAPPPAPGPSGVTSMAATDYLLDPDHNAPHTPPAPVKPAGPYSITERMKQFAPTAEARLKPAFRSAGVAYPPAYVTLIGFKEEKRLQLYAAGADRKFTLIRTYPVRAASGVPGPKLREGDGQVPEGLYRVELLNPNSSYHLSLRVNYPSEYDRERAREDGRQELGGDIMIHGRAVSIGCLAMGDRAIEELFVLAGRMKLEDVRIILAPWDLRARTREQAAAADPLVAAALNAAPKWTPALHERIRQALARYPSPGAAPSAGPPVPAGMPASTREAEARDSSRRASPRPGG